MLRFKDGTTCYRTKSEDDSGVISLQYSFDGGSNIYDPKNKEKSNAEVIEETSMVESLPFKSIQHLKDTLCCWLDDAVERLGSDKEVSTRVDDDGKLHLMVHNVVVTDLEDDEVQNYYMTVEQVK